MELQDLAAGICKLNHLFCDSPLAGVMGNWNQIAHDLREPSRKRVPQIQSLLS